MSAMVEAAMQYLQNNEPFIVAAAEATEPERPSTPQSVAEGVVSLRQLGESAGASRSCDDSGRIPHQQS